MKRKHGIIVSLVMMMLFILTSMTVASQTSVHGSEHEERNACIACGAYAPRISERLSYQNYYQKNCIHNHSGYWRDEYASLYVYYIYRCGECMHRFELLEGVIPDLHMRCIEYIR